ncbi:uncharacterized protein N7496_005535 [Penicillium cataractarum]|uniref:Uncharacterized protein n=1 Tax=Penicillium cataractarum TaxID=2100454 RepID=A0A9W9SGC8_9EURO|nr:uncharacterized protein N7496_005535 [Penicillium cataractarum]KAJ5378126.1 hypothetical protein N7496_005535 [Penicillium cataractarum]
MRGSQIARVVALGLASATLAAAANDASYDPSLNFRPDNVTFSNLYHWVGSYYNGSTTIQIEPFGGVAAKEEGTLDTTWCPNLKGNTYNTKFDTILGLTERAKYNAGSNPLNVVLTLWDPGFNFSVLNASKEITDLPWDWALFSALPLDSYNGSFTEPDLFNLTLAETSKAPYNVSSTFTEYGSDSTFDSTYPIVFNMTSCNGTQATDWSAYMISNYYWPTTGSNISYPDPTFDIVFDDKTAKLTLDAYIQAVQGCEDRPQNQDFCEADTLIEAKMTITFEGTIDSYHSDELKTDSSKPTWLKTVGFNNSTKTDGNSTTGSGSSNKKNGSSGRQYPGAFPLAAGIVAAIFSSLSI